jgi:excisionase family DNA binding protein
VSEYQLQNFRGAIIKKRAKVGRLRQILGQPPPTHMNGQQFHVPEASIRRIHEDLQEEEFKLEELESELRRLESGQSSWAHEKSKSKGTPGFWKTLGSEFRSLEAKGRPEIGAHNIPSGIDTSGLQWALVRGTALDRLRFERMAERAMRELGYSGDSQSAVFAWLERVKGDSPSFRIGYSTGNRNGQTEPAPDGGFLERVCEGSADYCLKLENDAAAIYNADQGSILSSDGGQAPLDFRLEQHALQRKLENPKAFPLMSIQEVAAVTGKSVSTIYRWLDEGRLKKGKIPGRIQTSAVVSLLESAD